MLGTLHCVAGSEPECDQSFRVQAAAMTRWLLDHYKMWPGQRNSSPGTLE